MPYPPLRVASAYSLPIILHPSAEGAVLDALDFSARDGDIDFTTETGITALNAGNVLIAAPKGGIRGNFTVSRVLILRSEVGDIDVDVTVVSPPSTETARIHRSTTRPTTDLAASTASTATRQANDKHGKHDTVMAIRRSVGGRSAGTTGTTGMTADLTRRPRLPHHPTAPSTRGPLTADRASILTLTGRICHRRRLMVGGRLSSASIRISAT